MQDFAQLAIPEQLKENIAKERFHTPTPIQKRAIPFALEGRDILGISQTEAERQLLLPFLCWRTC